MILTPEQIDDWISDLESDYERAVDAATLRAYAEIVEAVAEDDPIDDDATCHYCRGGWGWRDLYEGDAAQGLLHSPDCPYLAARRLRGKE